MRKNIEVFFLLFFSSLEFIASPIAAGEVIDGKEIVKQMDILMRGDTMRGLYEMTIRDPSWERMLRLRAWENRREKKTFILILPPPKEEGIGTLKIGFEMRYLL